MEKASVTTPSTHRMIVHMLKGMFLVVKWARFLSFLAVSGRVHITAVQYQFMAAALCTASDGAKKLCTYKSVRGPQRLFMILHCFPKIQVYFINTTYRRLSLRHTEDTVSTINGQLKDPRDYVGFVFPSQWARIYILTAPIYEELCVLDPDRALMIEDAPLIYQGNRKNTCLGHPHSGFITRIQSYPLTSLIQITYLVTKVLTFYQL